MRRLFAVAVPVVLLAAGSTACATKKFVRGEVGQVNEKVEGLSGQLEETQERTRQNEARIGEVDSKAENAGRSAQAAQTTATQAVERANAVGQKADALEVASRRLVYEVVLSEDQGNFRFGKSDLPDEAKARIDEVINDLKADPKGVFIEIEGHTDSVGPTPINQEIGMQRAEAVKRYLYEAHQVPLHKINVISYGEEKPIAPNNTRQGRAQNRRVVIKVLA
jgi:outer membrane protein OmpA-like peptidoglycan-associated protein